MLGLLTKGIFILLISGGLGFGAIFLSDLAGQITINFGDRELRISLLTGVVSLFGFLLLSWLAYLLFSFVAAVLRFFIGDETALSRFFDRARRAKGYNALLKTLIAISEGDKEKALFQSKRANNLLTNDKLAILISAQIAQKTGNPKLAISQFKKLLSNKETRGVALNGIVSGKINSGEFDDALLIAKKSIQINPRNIVALETLFNLQLQERDWSGARITLQKKYKIEKTSKDDFSRKEAILLFGDAKQCRVLGHTERALKLSVSAVQQYPTFVTALSFVTELEVLSGNKKRAERFLKKGWNLCQHPEIASSFASLEPDETAEERFKRFQPFFKNKARVPEVRILKAELLIAMEDFLAARKELSSLAENDPDSHVLVLMAAIERGLGSSEKVVKGWLAKAVSAKRSPAWICKNCGVQKTWDILCSGCEGFDIMDWKRPSGVETSLEGSQMLPLILDSSLAVGERSENTDDAPTDILSQSKKPLENEQIAPTEKSNEPPNIEDKNNKVKDEESLTVNKAREVT
ncbi:MAG: heme biosynthesis HemY N-terminal domain-containing protein [Pseudomonadota bacterium]|nr:heme biosynthesis HemY N-terminal domain-containing protein [Pseudomonadota bacterium]